jgi:hypothetical protein
VDHVNLSKPISEIEIKWGRERRLKGLPRKMWGEMSVDQVIHNFKLN